MESQSTGSTVENAALGTGFIVVCVGIIDCIYINKRSSARFLSAYLVHV